MLRVSFVVLFLVSCGDIDLSETSQSMKDIYPCYELANQGWWWYHQGNANIQYKLSTKNLSQIGVSPTQLNAAIAVAADYINDHSGGNNFFYAGTTNEVDRPYTGCTDGFGGLVVVEDVCKEDTLMDIGPRCCDLDSGMCHGFVLRVYLRARVDSVCRSNAWSVGLHMDDTHYQDVQSAVLHELGHTLKLDHNENYKSVMYYNSDPLSVARRDWYEQDVICHDQIGPRRHMAPRFMVQNSGKFWPPMFFGGAADTNQATIGSTMHSNGVDYVATCLGSLHVNWLEYYGAHTYRWPDYPGLRPYVGFTAMVPVDWQGVDYVFFSEDQTAGKFALNVFRSTDGFRDDRQRYAVSTCNQMAPGRGLSCDYRYGVTPVYTGHRIASTVEPTSGQPILMWLDQTRDASTYNRVMMSVGRVALQTFSKPDDMQTRSLVTPGVACKPGLCIMVYTDAADADNQVRIRDFTVAWDTASSRYKATVSAQPHQIMINVPTAAPIAAWYYNNKFYVAIRSARVGQPLEIYSSVSGIDRWSVEDNTVWKDDRPPYFGPSVVKISNGVWTEVGIMY